MKTWAQIVICTLIFIAALLTTTKRQKQSKCSSKNKQINKKLYAHTMEYYSAIKKEGN